MGQKRRRSRWSPTPGGYLLGEGGTWKRIWPMKAPRPINKAVFQAASWRQNLGRLLGWGEETSAPKNRNDKVGSRGLLGTKRWSPSEEAYASRTEGGPERVPWGKVQERGREEEVWSSRCQLGGRRGAGAKNFLLLCGHVQGFVSLLHQCLLTARWQADRALGDLHLKRLSNACFIFCGVGLGQGVSSGPWLAVFITSVSLPYLSQVLWPWQPISFKE